MLEARIPAGRHTIELTYWPAAFSAGLALGVISGASICIALIATVVKRRTLRAES